MCAIVWQASRGATRVTGVAAKRAIYHAVLFSIGALPFVAAIAALQNAMYGGPLTSGYGDLGGLFSVSHILPNLARYPVWLVLTDTPFVLLALAAPWTARDDRERAWIRWSAAFAVVSVACYLIYLPFDTWWYLRFVLPAFPIVFAMSSAVAVRLMSRLPVASRTVCFAVTCGLLVTTRLGIAVDRDVFRLQDFEKRFRDGGEYVAAHLPANAAVITVWESGSVRFYSGRLTLLWNSVEPDALESTVAFLEAQGYRPYFLFETNEEAPFRQRFATHTSLGALEWPPLAQIDRSIRIFDPADLARYRRGEYVKTDRVRTKR
jgi:hypothetical protein